jgi:hypothetical protein
LGAGGHRFKSCRPDQHSSIDLFLAQIPRFARDFAWRLGRHHNGSSFKSCRPDHFKSPHSFKGLQALPIRHFLT